MVGNDVSEDVRGGRYEAQLERVARVLRFYYPPEPEIQLYLDDLEDSMDLEKYEKMSAKEIADDFWTYKKALDVKRGIS